MIWSRALPGPRYVEFRTNSHVNAENLHHSRDPKDLVLAAVEKAPELFFVCHEAREEVLKVYQPLKGTKKGFGVVWFDPRTDVLCLRTEYFHPLIHILLQLMDTKTRERLENLAVDACIIDA